MKTTLSEQPRKQSFQIIQSDLLDRLTKTADEMSQDRNQTKRAAPRLQ